MSESSTRFCPYCGTEIQLDQVNNGTGIKASTILKGVGAVIAVPCAVASLAGFGVGGVVGGSLAAVWQASVGNVAAGSGFATLQSLGATGGLYSGMAYGGTAFGAGKVWEYKDKKSTIEGSDGDEGNDECKGNHGNGDYKNSSETIEGEADEEDGGEVTLTCPRCERSFRVSAPTDGTPTIDEEVERIAQ
ncbi:MAG: hypothetical protein SGBAC_006348 [Bacillariaceae sp.]